MQNNFFNYVNFASFNRCLEKSIEEDWQNTKDFCPLDLSSKDAFVCKKLQSSL